LLVDLQLAKDTLGTEKTFVMFKPEAQMEATMDLLFLFLAVLPSDLRLAKDTLETETIFLLPKTEAAAEATLDLYFLFLVVQLSVKLFPPGFSKLGPCIFHFATFGDCLDLLTFLSFVQNLSSL
jgi:hypothetical protein